MSPESWKALLLTWPLGLLKGSESERIPEGGNGVCDDCPRRPKGKPCPKWKDQSGKGVPLRELEAVR